MEFESLPPPPPKKNRLFDVQVPNRMILKVILKIDQKLKEKL